MSRTHEMSRGRLPSVQLALVDLDRATPAVNGRPGSPSRDLPTTIHVPAEIEPAPLIVLAHGAGGDPERFVDLASHWAEAGYVVAVPRFPLSNSSIAPPVLDFEEQGRDIGFVIDALLANNSPVVERIDGQRIGLFGLSLGSLSVWKWLFGAGVDIERVGAVIQSDGFGLYDDVQRAAIDFPVLIVHSDADSIFDYAVTRAQFDALCGPKFLLTLHGAIHATVAEDTITAADSALHAATTVFWHRFLAGRPNAPFPSTVDVANVTTFEAVAAQAGEGSSRAQR